MMEVTSAVKPSTGSAFSIDSIMSRRDRDRDSREAVSVVAGTSRDSEQRVGGGLPSVCTVTVPAQHPPLHGSSLPIATASVTTSCACPPVSPLESLSSSTGSISHPHPHHPASPHSPTSSPLGDSLHHPGLSAAAVAARNSNGLHPSHLSLSASAATEAALLHNRAIAAAAAAQNAHTLHTQQQQAAAMAGLSALDPHGTAALTAGGVGTIPTLPSFSTLTHHPADRGLAALQALSHKIQGLPPSLGVSGLPGGGAGGPLGPHHHGLGNGLAGLGPKHVLPLYSWFSRPGGYWTHRLPGTISRLPSKWNMLLEVDFKIDIDRAIYYLDVLKFFWPKVSKFHCVHTMQLEK